MKKIFVLAMILGVAFGAHLLSGKPQANANIAIESGDLIRGETFSAVYYYGSDGFRYVFPNFKTYSTWYDNFDDVKLISDSQLGQLQIGGNVTYRPGVRMVKVDTNPVTYAVDAHGVLRHVSSEEVAVALYGSTWNQYIDDVPDAFYANYTIGDPINNAGNFVRNSITAAASSINVDKQLQAPAELVITDSAYTPNVITIAPGGAVRFTNNGTTRHSATGDDLTWGTGTMMPGRANIQEFPEAGTFTFFDSYNSQLTGVVYVQ